MTPDDPLLERYREANALDPARPSPRLRENVLRRAHAMDEVNLGQSHTAAANDASWRWRTLGGLAALGLATLVVLQFDRAPTEDREAELGRAPAPAAAPAPEPAIELAPAIRSADTPARERATAAPKPAGPTSTESISRSQVRPAAPAALAPGADVNAADAQGRTALMRAALQGDVALVRRLLDAGADPLRRDRDGRHAADLAREAGHDALLPLLEAATAPPR